MRYVCAMAVEHEDSVEKVLHSSSSAAQSFVAASWCRSGLKYGLDAGADQGRELVSGSELTQRRERHGLMLEVARPLLDQLFQTVQREDAFSMHARVCRFVASEPALIVPVEVSNEDHRVAPPPHRWQDSVEIIGDGRVFG